MAVEPAPGAATPSAAVVALAPIVAAHADESERDRSLAPAIVAALRAAGLFRLCVPAAFGGLEADPLVMLETIERVAALDGATGWNLMVAAEMAFAVCANLPDTALRDVYADGPDAIVAGSNNPRTARAARVDDGYRLSGRWPFASGCRQAAWFAGSGLVVAGGEPVRGPSGAPVSRLCLVPAADWQIEDTWHTLGLRGTGSHDLVVTDRPVPAERTFDLASPPARPRAPLYAVPVAALLPATKAAVACGIGRHAIAALTDLAAEKTPHGATHPLRESALVQADMARAEALLRGGRALVYESMAAIWETVTRGDLPTPGQRTAAHLAAVQATQAAAAVVDLMFNAAGATAIYERSPLERCFRDIHTVTAHGWVQGRTWDGIGRQLLGETRRDP